MKNPAGTSFLDRLKQVMKMRRLTQHEVAALAGVSQPAVSGWFKGRLPYRRTIEPLCVQLELNEDWLLHGVEPVNMPHAQREERAAKDQRRRKTVRRIIDSLRDRGRNVVLNDPDAGTERMFSFAGASDEAWGYVSQQVEDSFKAQGRNELPPKPANNPPSNKVVHLPLGHELRPLLGQIAAGMPQEAIQQAEEFVILPPRLAADTTFALKVRGDSMIDREIYHGDIVLLNHRRTPRPGNVVAALCDHETCLKTYVVDKKTGPHLRAENKRFPAQIIPQDEMVIQGVMVGKVSA